MAALGPLAPDAVLLHVGGPKTGTSALQSALVSTRTDLAKEEVLFPGNDISHNRHFWQVAGYPEHPLMAAVGQDSWPGLLAQVQGWQGRVMLSAEILSAASAEAACEIVDALGPERVTVLITARPPAFLVTSVWQEYLKGGGTLALADWLSASGLGESPASDLRFLLHADYADMARRWLMPVTPLQVVLHVNRGHADQSLAQLLTSLLDLPRDWLTVDEAVNRSLTVAEAEVLRQINLHYRRKNPEAPEYALVPPEIVELLVRRTPGPGEQRLRADERALERVREWTVAMIEELTGLGIRVSGELEWLLSALPAGEPEIGDLPPDLAALLASATG